MPVALNHAAAASYRGDVYVLGGYRGERDLTRARSRRSTATTPTATAGAGCRRRRPPARALAVGVIGHRLYAAGGANARDGALATLEIYDFRSRRWRAGPDMAVPREHLAGAVAGGRFYALAGRAAGRGNFRVVEAFDPRARRWRRVPSMGKARGGIGAATVGGRIVVVGGEEEAGTIREVELFDPASVAGAVCPTCRRRATGSGSSSRRGRVYAIEGGDRPGFAFTSTIEALDAPGAARRAVQISSTGQRCGPTRRSSSRAGWLGVLGRVELVQAGDGEAVADQLRDPVAVGEVELDGVVVVEAQRRDLALRAHAAARSFGPLGGAVSATSTEFVRNTSWPPGRSSRAASAIQASGSHQSDAPYSLSTRSAQRPGAARPRRSPGSAGTRARARPASRGRSRAGSR